MREDKNIKGSDPSCPSVPFLFCGTGYLYPPAASRGVYTKILIGACLEGKIELHFGTRIVEIGVLLQCLSTILLALFSNPLWFRNFGEKV